MRPVFDFINANVRLVSFAITRTFAKYRHSLLQVNEVIVSDNVSGVLGRFSTCYHMHFDIPIVKLSSRKLPN